MKTTLIVFEYLAAGNLVILAILILGINSGIIEYEKIAGSVVDVLGTGNSLIIAFVLLSITYSVGVVSEYLGWLAFEWRLNAIKRTRIKAYLIANRSKLTCSPVLSGYEIDIKKWTPYMQSCLTRLHGEMRFFLMENSKGFAEEIASHIGKMRLVRVLFLVQFLFCVSMVLRLKTGYIQSWVWMVIYILIIFMFANGIAINQKFKRYCRSIERGYKTMVLDKASSSSIPS